MDHPSSDLPSSSKQGEPVRMGHRRKQANSYELTDKPFTKALLSRASQYQDDARQDLEEMVGRVKPITSDRTFDDFVASCAVTIAYHITTEAMQNIGRDPAFMPDESVPRYAPMVVAYSLFVLAGIEGELRVEGVDLEFKETAADTANLFFMLHPDQERAKNALDGIRVFQSVATAPRDNVKEWMGNLLQLVPMFVLQWTTENQQLNKTDFVPLFGSLLSGFLKVVT